MNQVVLTTSNYESKHSAVVVKWNRVFRLNDRQIVNNAQFR